MDATSSGVSSLNVALTMLLITTKANVWQNRHLEKASAEFEVRLTVGLAELRETNE